MSARLGAIGVALIVTGAALIIAGSLTGDGPSAGSGLPGPMMGGAPMMGGTGGMSGAYPGEPATHPGDPGFVAGTPERPRVVAVVAGPGYTFSPATIQVAKGETVTFQVTSMGGLVHEFMVGPADAVAADREGTPEVADLGMMQVKSVTYTFDGDGPYAFACHAPGHYEAGMQGTITIVG